MPMLEKAGEEKWGSDPEYQHYMKDPAAGFGCEDGRFWCEEGWCGSAAVLQLTEGGKLQQTSPKDRTCRVGKLFAPAVPIGAFFWTPGPRWPSCMVWMVLGNLYGGEESRSDPVAELFAKRGRQ